MLWSGWRCQLSVKCAGRFSRKAATPSARSSVAAARPPARASSTRDGAPSAAASISCLPSCTARGAPARRSALSRSTPLPVRPWMRRRWPGPRKRLPRRRAGAGSGPVPWPCPADQLGGAFGAAPAWDGAQAGFGQALLCLGGDDAEVAGQASSSPPPKASPSMTAMLGWRSPGDGVEGPVPGGDPVPPHPAADRSAKWLMSAPTQKTFSPAVRTMTSRADEAATSRAARGQVVRAVPGSGRSASTDRSIRMVAV
jgi:hypothetical protein